MKRTSNLNPVCVLFAVKSESTGKSGSTMVERASKILIVCRIHIFLPHTLPTMLDARASFVLLIAISGTLTVAKMIHAPPYFSINSNGRGEVYADGCGNI